MDPNYVLRLSNPPSYNPITPQQAEGLNLADSNGFSYLNSINIPGGAISTQTKTPYIQDWNLAISRSFGPNFMVEVAYVGSKGTHLYFSRVNLNMPDPNWIVFLEDNGLSGSTAIPDPLHRCVPGMIPDIAGGTLCSGTPPPKGQPARHNVVSVPLGSLFSPYIGFGALNTYDIAGASSIRHAAYVSIVHRPQHGFTWSMNYTFGKSIDDASNGSPDKNVLTVSKVDGGQITYGGTPQGDRSVSTFDVKHDFNFVGVYDLPLGRGQRFLSNAWRPLDLTVGGWTVSGVERLFTGFPGIVTEATANDLGNSQTHDIRPNIISGVPLINPLWSRSCPVGNLCQPYVNPAAFEERPVAQLGTAPRTLDAIRGPLQQTLDLSVQKNFQISERWRIQLRVDAINVLNHPLFRQPVLNEGGAGANGIDVFGGGPNGGRLSLADYNTWAAFNSRPLATSTSDPNIVEINARIDAQRGPAPTGATGTNVVAPLPANFFTVPVPQGFALTNPNSFDITDPTLAGYKLYRVRQDYEAGSSYFGTLHVASASRYLQFGLRIFF